MPATMVSRTTLTLPSALEPEQVESWLEPARRGQAAAFLDYDGTLTPIVNRPELATLSDAARDVLRRLAARCPVTIVSGRDNAVVSRFVCLDTLGYVGSHGFDIVGPPGTGLRREVAHELVPELDAVEDELRHRLDGIQGALVERKRFSVATHVRLVADKDLARVQAVIEELRADHPLLRRALGKKVIEFQPDIDWDKGIAVRWMLAEMGLDESVALYIGDDLTDETVFGALAGRATTIVVTEEGRPTAARFRLRDPEEVHLLLGRLVDAFPVVEP